MTEERYVFPIIPFVRYAADGRILESGKMALGHVLDEIDNGRRTAFFLEDVDANLYYVNTDTGVLTLRPTLSHTFDSLQITVSQNATIEDLPEGALITVTGPISASETHDGGDFEFGSDEPGTYVITVDLFPYLSKSFTIEVTG